MEKDIREEIPETPDTQNEGSDAPDLNEDFSAKDRRSFDLKILLLPLVLICLFGGLLWYFLNHRTDSGQLVINEVCTANHACLQDQALGTPDWVELYNGSNRAVDLKDYGLSDSMKNCYKYKLPEVTLEPGQYLLVYFTGGTAAADENPYCTGFGLNRAGETIVLVDNNYNLLDSVEVPALEEDVTYARTLAGEWGYALTPTPLSANEGEILSNLY